MKSTPFRNNVYMFYLYIYIIYIFLYIYRESLSLITEVLDNVLPIGWADWGWCRFFLTRLPKARFGEKVAQLGLGDLEPTKWEPWVFRMVSKYDHLPFLTGWWQLKYFFKCSSQKIGEMMGNDPHFDVRICCKWLQEHQLLVGRVWISFFPLRLKSWKDLKLDWIDFCWAL